MSCTMISVVGIRMGFLSLMLRNTKNPVRYLFGNINDVQDSFTVCMRPCVTVCVCVCVCVCV